MQCNTLYRRTWKDAPSDDLRFLMLTVCIQKWRSATFMADYTNKRVRKEYFWETFDVMYLKDLATSRFKKKVDAMREKYSQEVSNLS